MIRILTDSAADLTCADAALPGVTVVPLQVNFANGIPRWTALTSPATNTMPA